MRLVDNKSEHWEFIRTLRNDSRVKKGFIQQAKISKEDHIKYMGYHWYEYYICVDDTSGDTPMGYIGIVNNDIRICTHPNHQRKGVSLFMLKEIKKLHPKATAKVKIDNEESHSLFKKAGFEIKYYLYERAENDS